MNYVHHLLKKTKIDQIEVAKLTANKTNFEAFRIHRCSKYVCWRTHMLLLDKLFFFPKNALVNRKRNK